MENHQGGVTLSSPAIMGWRELIVLPELGIGPLHAKADTGALSAALHAENIFVYTKDRLKRVHFEAFIDEKRHLTKICDVALYGSKRIKNSSGRSEERWVIETALEIGDLRWRALVTLTDRADMGVPVLLGRASLRDHFIVHPGESYLLSRFEGEDFGDY